MYSRESCPTLFDNELKIGPVRGPGRWRRENGAGFQAYSGHELTCRVSESPWLRRPFLV